MPANPGMIVWVQLDIGGSKCAGHVCLSNGVTRVEEQLKKHAAHPALSPCVSVQFEPSERSDVVELRGDEVAVVVCGFVTTCGE